MAKGYNKSKVKPVLQTEKTKIISLSNGKTVRVKGIDSLIIDVLKESIKWPADPTYVIKTELLEETHKLTWEIANEEAATGDPELAIEYKTILDNHAIELRQANGEFNMKLMKAIVDGGILVMPEEDDDWADTMEFLGIGQSSNKKQRKYDYVISNLISDDEDLFTILEAVMELTGVPKKDLETARGMFRGSIPQE